MSISAVDIKKRPSGRDDGRAFFFGTFTFYLVQRIEKSTNYLQGPIRLFRPSLYLFFKSRMVEFLICKGRLGGILGEIRIRPFKLKKDVTSVLCILGTGINCAFVISSSK
ncbi:hypothetical protein BGP_5695 [Beggiatoa sp. PS]|nr:hypothetical protein BGP_5695 [Beggiatoa sp. PS]